MQFAEFWAEYVRCGLAGRRRATLAHATSAGRAVPAVALAELNGRWAAELARQWIERYCPATASSYARRIAAGLSWGHAVGHLSERLSIPVPTAPAAAKGRPLTDEEFAGMLKAAARRYGGGELERIMQGLWHSGLRLGEILALSWDPLEPWHAERHAGRWFLRIPSEQKNKQTDLLPATPGLEALLTPAHRSGPLFPSSVNVATVGRRIADCGAHVCVTAGRTATAHDLRRSFAMRWAEAGLAESELATLMRHRHVQTTRQYYEVISAQRLGARMFRLGGK